MDDLMGDMVLESTIGMNKEQFLRTAGLMRNPEGFDGPKRCPLCKKKIITNEEGHMFCENFSSNYEKDGKCYWHRYEDGLNYWSKPEEVFDTLAKKDPEFKALYDKAKESI